MMIQVNMNEWERKEGNESSNIIIYDVKESNIKLYENLFFGNVTPENMHKEEDYYGLVNNHVDNITERIELNKDKDEIARSKLIDKLIPSQGNDKIALDIGCSDGYFMNILRNKGYYAYGYDICAMVIEKAKIRYPHLIYYLFNKSFYEDTKLNEVDLILITEILEHIYDLDKFMDNIYRGAKQNALVVISVPNYCAKNNPRWQSNEHLRAWYPYGLWKFLSSYLEGMMFYSLRGLPIEDDSYLILTGKVNKCG